MRAELRRRARSFSGPAILGKCIRLQLSSPPAPSRTSCLVEIRYFAASFKMRWLFSFLLLALLGLASARSIAGSRLLVVLEDAAEKEQYGVFLGDLEGELPFNPSREIFPHSMFIIHFIVCSIVKICDYGHQRLSTWHSKPQQAQLWSFSYNMAECRLTSVKDEASISQPSPQNPIHSPFSSMASEPTTTCSSSQAKPRVSAQLLPQTWSLIS